MKKFKHILKVIVVAIMFLLYAGGMVIIGTSDEVHGADKLLMLFVTGSFGFVAALTFSMMIFD